MPFPDYKDEMHLSQSLIAPINTHKMAHNAPRTEKRKNPPFLLLLLVLLLIRVEESTGETVVLFILILLLPKLDTRSNVRLTRPFSAAEAGVVGIVSTKAQRAEETRLAEPPSSRA